MHHQSFSGDPPGTGSRKAAYLYRRGSGGASASAAGAGVNTVDDNPTQAGSSSPSLHQQPQSQVAVAQVKKKSGFQITSVTSAQINVSGNNSLADDTESYDDMDESHTEDLSSSEMLDVSVSRATDTGLPERSSSDETLNSLHGVDTPGLVSPNEPLNPHSIPQGSQMHTSMVNGTMHHHYYPQQQSLHHTESLGGGEAPMPAHPGMPLSSSSPGTGSKAGTNQSQRPAGLDSSTQAGGPSQPLAPNVGGKATDAHLQGSPNFSNVAAAPDNTSVSGQVVSTGGGTGQSAAAPVTQTQHTQTQTATGSRFRVVKLDTNSEPFRKGRWTCTEYYEKEIPPAAVTEAPKGAEVASESETANTGMPAVQPPHTLQAYQLPSQDFTSPQAMMSPPQGLVQTTPVTFVSPQEVAGVALMQKPVAPVNLPTATPQVTAQAGVNQPPVMSQQLPYAVDRHQVQTQGGYPTPQHNAGVIAQGGVRQPDFIQPTAPFQTQVQPPLPHVTSITPGSGVPAQLPVNITQQHQGQVAPPALATSALQHQLQAQVHQPSTATIPLAHPLVTSYMPLTALHADLQPILTPGATLNQAPIGGTPYKTSQLEDAQKLLFQHQGLLALPRLAAVTGVEGFAEASATGSLAHMGMSAEASAFMAAAAAGLRGQHAEGEDDR